MYLIFNNHPVYLYIGKSTSLIGSAVLHGIEVTPLELLRSLPHVQFILHNNGIDLPHIKNVNIAKRVTVEHYQRRITGPEALPSKVDEMNPNIFM